MKVRTLVELPIEDGVLPVGTILQQADSHIFLKTGRAEPVCKLAIAYAAELKVKDEKRKAQHRQWALEEQEKAMAKQEAKEEKQRQRELARQAALAEKLGIPTTEK